MMLHERFVYLPLHMSAVREKFAELYQEDQLFEDLLDWNRLPNLFDRLDEAVRANRLQEWAMELARVDLYLLTHGFTEVPAPLLAEAAEVLRIRYTTAIGRAVFRNWRRGSGERILSHLLRQMWMDRDLEHWGIPLAPQAARDLLDALGTEDPVGALTRCLPADGHLSESLAMWHLQGSSLGDHLLFRVLRTGDANTFSRAFPDTGAFRHWLLELEGLRHEDLLAIMDRYLAVVPLFTFDAKLIEGLVIHWGPANPPVGPWLDLSEQALRQLDLWHKDHKLAAFLDHERYRFWRRYLDRAETIHNLRHDRDVLIIHFPNCVAVEFMEVGKAARVLDKKTFARTRWDRRAAYGQLSTADLTDFRTLPVLVRIIHSGAWQFTAEHDLRRYIGRPTAGLMGGVD